MAVNKLKEKARRAFQFQIPIRTSLKIFQSVIEPIVLYGRIILNPSKAMKRTLKKKKKTYSAGPEAPQTN